MTNSKLPDLPADIWCQILSFLPARTLLRFKSVCKEWHSLITSQKFINKHNVNQVSGSDLIALCPYDSVNDSNPIHPTIMIYSLDNKHPRQVISPRYLFSFYYEVDVNFEWLGYCNGLILIGIHDTRVLLVWNHFLGKYKHLEAPDVISDKYLFGLGYDALRHQHKVVVFTVRNCPSSLGIGKVLVCNIEDNIWTEVEDHANDLPGKYLVPRDKISVVLDGCLHWLCSLMDLPSLEINYFDMENSFMTKSQPLEIIYFDMEKNKLGYLPLPRMFTDWKWDEPINLGVLDGCLSLTYLDNDTQYFHTFLLKHYGKVEPWKMTKLFKVPGARICPELNIRTCHPICFNEDHSEVVMQVKSTTIVKLPTSRNKRGLKRAVMEKDLAYIDTLKSLGIRLRVSVDSLVSFPLDDYQRGRRIATK